MLPERPVQLIHPDPNHHRNLEVIGNNVRLLHHINTAVAVVAVVGKFHSGKSFLLNQLMGKQEGFGVGPSVRPHTMGIWMWGKVKHCPRKLPHLKNNFSLFLSKPMMTKLPSGEPLSVIFLDTEGQKQLARFSATLIFCFVAQGLLPATYQRPMMPRYFLLPLY